MPSTSTDQLQGLSTSVALKAPCKVQTTANITLSGEQTINSVAVVDGDRVLVKDQTTASENGIWVVRSTAWERAKDFDGTRDVVCGTRCPVYRGTGDYSEYAVATTGTITPGSTSISFVLLATNISGNINGTSLTLSGSITAGGGFTLSGGAMLNGGATLGDASGDALLINSTAATLGGNLNIDAGTFFIDRANDRVGFGQTSPTTRVEANGTVYVNTGALWINRANATTPSTAGSVQLRIDGSASAHIGTPASGALAFYGASGVEGARFSATAFALQLSRTGSPLGKLEMNNASSDGLHCANFQTDGVNVFRVEADGDARNLNNSYGAISDAKLKRDIQDAKSMRDKARLVRLVTYVLISDPKNQKMLGVLAQELQEIFPGLVKSEPDMEEYPVVQRVPCVRLELIGKSEDGLDVFREIHEERDEVVMKLRPTGTVTLSVKYSVLSLILFKAWQESEDLRDWQIADLTSRLLALEAK